MMKILNRNVRAVPRRPGYLWFPISSPKSWLKTPSPQTLSSRLCSDIRFNSLHLDERAIHLTYRSKRVIVAVGGNTARGHNYDA